MNRARAHPLFSTFFHIPAVLPNIGHSETKGHCKNHDKITFHDLFNVFSWIVIFEGVPALIFARFLRKLRPFQSCWFHVISIHGNIGIRLRFIEREIGGEREESFVLDKRYNHYHILESKARRRL